MTTIQMADFSLPKGGGAIRGLGLGLEAPGSLGTATLSVPINLLQARAVAPALNLVYRSGAGNGPYGAGATIALPSISRATAAGVPSYTLADTLVFSEVGILVAKGVWNCGVWEPDTRTETDAAGVSWQIQVYIPQQASSQPLIEQWTSLADGHSYWRVISADNVESHFGRGLAARISDPNDPNHIFEWLLEAVFDAKGNRAQYQYKSDDAAGFTNRYIQAIRYGNYLPAALEPEAFAYEVVFDYGEYDLDHLDQPGANPYSPVQPWLSRPDAFSSFRSGFEIRTRRLCQGVLTFLHFPTELGATPCLNAAMRLHYTQSLYLSTLDSLTSVGYGRQPDGAYQVQSLPAVTWCFSAFAPPPAPRFKRLSVQRAAPLPGYLTPGSYQPVDLDGAGLPGFLQSDGVSTCYYEPLGDGYYNAPLAPAKFPDCRNLASSNLALTDLDSNGRLELLVTAGNASGYFQHNDDGGWSGLRALAQIPTAYDGSSVEPVDLNGDGKVDLLLTGSTQLHYYPSLGLAGYGSARVTQRPDGFPASSANSERVSVAFADVFGDGLSHRVKVSNGEVAVWPCLGHGRYGARRVLANSPQFTRQMSAGRLYFADVDGAGNVDIVFALTDHLLIFRNQSGNGFSEPLRVPLPIRLGQNDQVSFADILGNGTTSIVITRISPKVEHWYCDLCAQVGGEAHVGAGGKPYLLTASDNGLGATAQIRYASSTRFYLADKQAGRPWVTRLPFPVQVVTQIVSHDAVSQVTFTQRFAYHDGYFDPATRIFRGFGCVEAWDAQAYAPFSAPPGTAWPVGRLDTELQVPPAHTKTWFCLGAYFQSAELSAQYAKAYFQGDPFAAPPLDNVFDAAVLTGAGKTLMQAHAALAGRVIHTEVYADDGDPLLASFPYTVTDTNFEVLLIQSAGPGGLCAFTVRDRQSIQYDYEREPTDPRIHQTFLLASSQFDPDTTQTSYREQRCIVFLGRRNQADAVVYPEQRSIKANLDTSWLTRVLAPFRLISAPIEQQACEIGGLTPPASGYFEWDSLHEQINTALSQVIPYGQPFEPGTLQARLSARNRHYYWNLAQDAPLPLGQITARALLHHDEEARFSDYWRTETFGTRLNDTRLQEAGMKPDGEGYWIAPSVTTMYAPPDQPTLYFQRIGDLWSQPGSTLFASASVTYDTPYALFPVSVTESIDTQSSLSSDALIDYQTLEPWQLTDANGVVQQVLYDARGNVLAQSQFKPASGNEPRVGNMDLADYIVRPAATFDAVLADPAYYLQGASAFYFYDVTPHQDADAQPASAISLHRTRFVSDAVTDALIECSIEFTDGFGQVAEAKRECESGPALLHDARGMPLLDARGQPRRELVGRRWQVSGRTVYNNKGLPAQQYLPYYSDIATYENQQWLASADVTPLPSITHYDPLGRVIRVDTPKGFFTRTVHQAWQTLDYDENDTLPDAPYFVDFMANYPANPTPAQIEEKNVLLQILPCYNTPVASVIDNLGEKCRLVVCNLGEVAPDAFAAIVAGGSVTSTELWAALVTAGYLETHAGQPGTWVSALFQPYTAGFALTLPAPYDAYAQATTTLLVQACLTSFIAADRYGRVLEWIDPRLYLANVQTHTDNRNFRYAYPMASSQAARTDSADAGSRWVLNCALDTPMYAWDALGRTQQKSFDGLARLLRTQVTEADGTQRTSELLTYGETVPDAAERNLNGQLYLLKDEAGTLSHARYSLLGQIAESSRQFALDPRIPPDWANPVALQSAVYRTQNRYDALQRKLSEQVPDTRVITWTYALSGRLQGMALNSGGASEPFIIDIVYSASDQREQIFYGNQALQTLDYEITTERLTSISAQRAANASNGMPRDPTVQQVSYVYDPVGNLRLMHDRTAEQVFCGATQPQALCAYAYDPLYRLISATGLQHPDIKADTHVSGFMQSLYAELCPASAPPVTLENYQDDYAFDDSGNLLQTRHHALSASFERNHPVTATSNRLLGVPYDANGNTLQTELQGAVTLGWDERNNLANTGAIEKADGEIERVWLAYDFTNQQVQRVMERAPAAGQPANLRETRVIVGSYVRRQTTDLLTGVIDTVNSLRIQDGNSALLVSNQGGIGPQRRYQLDDKLGSVSIELDDEAALVSYEAFYPFGGTCIIAGQDQAQVAAKSLRYSGKEVDDSTGFYYYGARYYLSWQGRWLNPDPAGPVDGANLMQFVNNNPMSYVDHDGRGKAKPDAPKPPSVYQMYAQGLLKSFMYTIYNAPRIAYVNAPKQLMQRYSLDANVRQATRDAALDRREETKLLYYNLAVAWGKDPAKYLPPVIIDMIKSQRAPWSLVPIPFTGTTSLHKELRAKTSTPAFWGSTTGEFLGNFLTVGTSLVLSRQLFLSSLPKSVKLMLSPILVGQVLGMYGHAYETEKVYSKFQEDQKKLWFYQRTNRPWLSGIPKKMVYMDHQALEADKLWQSFSSEQIGLTVGALMLARMFGPMLMRSAMKNWSSWASSPGWGPWNAGRGYSGTTAVTLYQPRSRELMTVARRSTLPAVITQPITALMVPRPAPSTALTLYQPPRQNLPALFQRANWLTLYRPPITALMPLRVRHAQLVLFVMSRILK
ncbi:VCBS repeat-containing protein [Pseudomonas veronii]|uniref:SpvB/TcaC N-terminal domain-containing protein n=1 Tax=Pseudomonas veronii TaxID=76761 RepID=UPI0018E744AB|nr:VCBS repeat-containing protein [Pseudomonas veronii]